MNAPPMDTVVKTSLELTASDKQRMDALFAMCFEGRRLPAPVLDAKYLGTFRGYSYHCLLYEGGSLYGAYTAIPARFRFFGRELTFAFAADAMVDPARRNILQLRAMAEMATQAMRDDGVDFLWGAGKAEMTAVNCRMLGWRYFGRAQTHVAVNRYPSVLIKAARLLLSRRQGAEGVRVDPAASFVTDLPAGTRPAVAVALGDYPIEKINDEAFKRYRYGYFPIPYKALHLAGGGEAVYVTEPYYPMGDKLPFSAAFLLDVQPLTRTNIEQAVRAIRRDENRDLTIHVGRMDFSPSNMHLLPASLDLRPSYFSGRILSGRLDERVFDLWNWNMSLACSDVI